MPLFSVLIPTRDRPATLRHTLETVASQSGDDYEIVIADNASGPETRDIAERAGLQKVIYTRSDEILPMAENWERGLNLCTGEYVTVLGDDDAFLPSTLKAARILVSRYNPEILSWAPHTYWWPDTIVPWLRNGLFVSLDNQLVEKTSAATLQSFYRGELSFIYTPMIYSAFFHRSIIEDARLRFDGFFVPKDTAPDVASGILGLHISQTYLFCGRPLTIRGNSGKSSGTAQYARSLGATQREIYFREERMALERFIHPRLVPSPNLLVIVASAKLKCRDLYFPDHPILDVDLGGLLNQMIETLNHEPEAYEENLRDAVALAERIGVKLNMDAIPKMEPKDRTPNWGVHEKDGRVHYLSINGDLARLRHIGDAANLVEAILFPIDERRSAMAG